jgi:hypothetical protein
MDQTYNHLKVMNNALAHIAGGQIMAEDEDTELAEKVVPVYYSRLRAVFGMHEWSFAGKTYKLDAIAPTAENDYDATARRFNNGWHYAFALPGSRIGDPRKVLRDPRNHRDPLREFLIESGWLYADRDQAWAVVTVLADPITWSPLFALGIERITAADICVPVTHDAKLAEAIRTIAEGSQQEQGRGGLIGRAMATDAAKARTPTALARDPLTDARFM